MDPETGIFEELKSLPLEFEIIEELSRVQSIRFGSGVPVSLKLSGLGDLKARGST